MATKRKVVNPRLPGRYGKMTAAELDAEVARFDEESVMDEAVPLTPKQWAQELRARRKVKVVALRSCTNVSTRKTRSSTSRG